MRNTVLAIILCLPFVSLAQNGTVLNEIKISDTTANFTGVLGGGVNFGSGVAAIGDLNNDGITELVVGAYDVGGTGAVYTLFMNAQGRVDSFKLITEGQGGFTGDLDNDDRFGYSVAALGDLDLDNVPDVLVSSELDDDGGSERGAVWILYLNADGTVKSHAKISSITQGSLLAQPSYGIGDLDRFGSEVANLDDLDGDGIQDIAVSAIFDDDGGGNRGAVWIIFLNRNGSIKGFQKISDTQGGFTGTLQNFTFFGSGLATIGDLDGDLVQDIIVGQELEDANGTDKGAAWILFMNTNGTVKGHRELKSGLAGSGAPFMADNGYFGSACAALGDIDGDQIPDVAVGANGTDSQRGAVWILMMNANGSIKASQKISYNSGNLSGPLDFNDLFGNSVVSLGDINGDNKTDIAVGVAFDDDGGSDKGAVYILNLDGVPTNCVNASFSTTSNTACVGDSRTFTNNSTGPGTQTYVWKVNGATVSSNTNLTYTFNNTGTYTVKLVVTNSSPACADSMQMMVNVAATSIDTVSQIICDGQSVLINGNWETTNGIYNDTFTNMAGCDSIIATRLFVLNIAMVTRDTIEICQGDSYQGYNTTGVYYDTIQGGAQCMVVITDLRVLPPVTQTVNETICFGSSYLGYTATGTYNDTFAAANTCDSIRTLNLTVLPANTTTITQSICLGDTLEGYFITGVYTDVFPGFNTCDSTRTLNLTVLTPIQTVLDTTVCFGQKVMGYGVSGTYPDTLTAANNCDSIFTLNLTVLPEIVTNLTRSICLGQSVDGYTTTGVYTDTFSASNGCDSIRVLDLTVANFISTTVDTTVCFGGSVAGYTVSGQYTDTFSTVGCDSIRTLNLTVLAENLATINQTICAGDTLEGYTTTGTYTDVLTDINGCDSTRTLNLTVEPLKIKTDTVTICEGDTFNGYFATGVYTDTIPNLVNCDSFYVLDLTVLPAPTEPIVEQQGNVLIAPSGYTSYQWYENGILVSGAENDTLIAPANGKYYVEVTDVNGCKASSVVIFVTGVGVDEAGIWELNYYPNPASTNLFLEYNGANAAQYSLHNNLGQMLLSGNLDTAETTAINLTSFAEGVYILKVQALGSVVIHRVFISR